MSDNQAAYASLAAILTGLAIALWITGWAPLLPIMIGVGLAGSLSKSVTRYLHAGWMALAAGLNFLVGKILLTAIFFLVVTPLAVAYRLFNRNKLMTRRGADSQFQIVDHDVGADDLKHPF